MAYFILFKNLDDIYTDDIQQIKNNVLLLFGIILLISYILLYYAYKKIQDAEIEKKNKALEESIKIKNNVLEYISLHDPLTSLPNRKLFKQKLSNILLKKNNSTTIYVLHLGIDSLKEVNDAYGHKTLTL